MKTLTLFAIVPFLAVSTALPAQEGGSEAVKPSAAKARQDPAKDDATTAEDPAIQAIDAFIKKQSVDTKKDGWRTSLSAPPKQTFSKDHDYFWHLETETGTLKVRYLSEAAPMHVTSGIYLARLGYYDGLGFHRIIPNFMAQGGCPNTGDPEKRSAWGTGGPGYFMDGEFPDGLKHDRPGLLSMANTGRPRTDGSQFFLTFVPTPWLDGRHTIWGEVVDGMGVVKVLEKRGSSENNGMLQKPVRILRTWVSVAPKSEKDGEKAGGEKAGDEGDGKRGGGR